MTQSLKPPSFETSIERAKDILLNDILEPRSNKSRITQMKRVRLSMDAKLIASHHESHQQFRFSGESTSSTKTRKSEDTQSIGEFIRSNSMSSTSSRKSIKQIPKFALEHFDDEDVYLRHGTHMIEIEILNLELCENSALIENENANFLYVEYSFLNYRGHLLETQSLHKPKKSGDVTSYNLKRKFEINPSENEKQFKLLKSMIVKNSKNPLKFLIVSEPIDDENDKGECEEIGFAIVKLNEIIEISTSDMKTIKTECYSTEYPHELIAYLNIKINGLNILKKLSKI